MARLPFRFALCTFTLALAGALLCADARATTIIPLSDADLTLSSRVIVQGIVTRVDVEESGENSVVFTFITFRVTRVIKGDVARGQAIVIKQIGGRVGANETQVSGLPYFARRFRLLLFLNTDDDGAFHVAHLSLGYFRILRGQGSHRDYVSRPQFGGVAIDGLRANGTITSLAPRDEFVNRIQQILRERREEAAKYERERGQVAIRPVPRDYIKRAGNGRVDFTFLSSSIRWEEPDTAKEIKFQINPDGAPTPSGGVAEAEAVANAWSTVEGSSLRIAIGGNTTSACGFNVDGVSAISFGDCLHQLDAPVNCTGVVAYGGISQASTSDTSSVGGDTFNRAIEGDIVFNNGFECLLTNSAIVEEVLTHEMGHALGFDHSSATYPEANPVLFDATMYFALHVDGRGASVRADDADAARYLYRAEGNGDDLAIKTDALPDAPVSAPYEYALEAKGSGPFTWSIASGELPTGLALSESGVISGTAEAEGESTLTFNVRDSGNYQQTRTLALKVSATPAPFLVSGSYDGEKLALGGLNLTADAIVTVNETLITPPNTVKFKEEKGKLTVKGKAADLNIRKGEQNSVEISIGGQSSNTLHF